MPIQTSSISYSWLMRLLVSNWLWKLCESVTVVLNMVITEPHIQVSLEFGRTQCPVSVWLILMSNAGSLAEKVSWTRNRVRRLISSHFRLNRIWMDDACPCHGPLGLGSSTTRLPQHTPCWMHQPLFQLPN